MSAESILRLLNTSTDSCNKYFEDLSCLYLNQLLLYSAKSSRNFSGLTEDNARCSCKRLSIVNGGIAFPYIVAKKSPIAEAISLSVFLGEPKCLFLSGVAISGQILSNFLFETF